MKDNQLPLVSVPVIAYNSSKTIVETLDSIFNQTYPNLELIVSDDGSTDNTVQVCREWIEAHKDRFVRVELLIVEKNTGISANLNRAERACQGEWVKGIAGDDLLLPNCVSDYVDYVKKNPDAIYVFGKMQFIGSPSGDYSMYEKVFDYSFFSLSPEEQLHKLVFERNYVPAATAFYNLRKLRELKLEGNDERIKLLEDYPKWIRLLKSGVTFHFLNLETVCYRISGISNKGLFSSEYYADCRRFDLYYLFDEWRAFDEKSAVEKMVEKQTNVYKDYLLAINKYDRLIGSIEYKLGVMLLKPFRRIKKWIHWNGKR